MDFMTITENYRPGKEPRFRNYVGTTRIVNFCSLHELAVEKQTSRDIMELLSRYWRYTSIQSIGGVSYRSI